MYTVNINASTRQTPGTIISLLFMLKSLVKRQTSPRTRVIWVKTEPNESPTFMSPWSEAEDIIELAISGRSVPIDTKTKPTMKGEIPSVVAIFIECSTALSLENIKRLIPRIKPTIAINASIAKNDT